MARNPGASGKIFWNARVEDRFEGGDFSTVISHYLRIKVFSAAGAARFSNVSIDTWEHATVGEVKARTIRPDGTIVALSNKAVFTTALVVIMLSGSIWVLYHLNTNMMPSMDPQAMRNMP